MFRALKDIREDLATAFKNHDKRSYTQVEEELKAFEDFWSEVESLSITNSNTDRLTRMRNYFETDSITKADADYLSTHFARFRELAHVSSDADEAVRLMSDFFRLEEDRPLERQISLANSGPIGQRFIYEEPIEVEPDVWIDCDVCSWLNSLQGLLEADDGLLIFYSARVPYKVICHVSKTLKRTIQSEIIVMSEGLYQAMNFPIEFLQLRDKRLLERWVDLAA